MHLDTADGAPVTRPDQSPARLPDYILQARLRARVDLLIRHMVAEGEIDRCAKCLGEGFLPFAASARPCKVCGGAGFLF